MQVVNQSVKTLRDTTKLLSSQAVSTGFSIFYFIVLTRILTKVELSSLAVLGIITTMSAMVTSLGFVGTCLKKAPEYLARGERIKACALMKTTIIFPFFLSFLTGGFVYFQARSISQLFFKTGDYAVLIKIIAFGVVVRKLHENFFHMLRVTQKFGILSIAKIIHDTIVKILALLFYFIFGINGYISAFIFGQLAVSLLIIYYLREFLFFKSGLYSLKKLIPYSLPYYGNSLVRFGSTQGDQLIIGIFLMPHQLATYYVARCFFNYLVVYIDSLLDPVMPKLAQLKSQGIQKVERAFYKTSRWLSFSVIPPGFLIASLSYPLLQLYGGGKYISGMSILILLSFAAIAYGIYSTYGISVYILGKPMDRFKQEGISCMTNLFLGLVLIIPLNIFGPALAKFFSLSGAALFSRHLLQRLSNSKFNTYALRQTLFASMVMAGIIVIGQLVYYNIFIVPLYVAIALFIFMFLFARNLDKEDISLIIDFLPYKLFPLLNIIYFFGGERLKGKLCVESNEGNKKRD